jgi:hypothetical protein
LIIQKVVPYSSDHLPAIHPDLKLEIPDLEKILSPIYLVPLIPNSDSIVDPLPDFIRNGKKLPPVTTILKDSADEESRIRCDSRIGILQNAYPRFLRFKNPLF